jgi:hypothetical protein
LFSRLTLALSRGALKELGADGSSAMLAGMSDRLSDLH